MRLVWTLPRRYTAAMVDTALVTAAIMDAGLCNAVRVDVASVVFRLLVDAAPFTAVGADADLAYCS